MIEENECSKDIDATYARNTKPVTVTLTAIEIFAVVSAVQASENANPALSPLGGCAQEAARKMHDCLDPNSLLSLQLNKAWNGEKNDG